MKENEHETSYRTFDHMTLMAAGTPLSQQKNGQDANQSRQRQQAAFQFTDAQKKQLGTIQQERAELAKQIQTELRYLLTKEQRGQLRGKNRSGSRRPDTSATYRDVKYGPYGRNVMDV